MKHLLLLSLFISGFGFGQFPKEIKAFYDVTSIDLRNLTRFEDSDLTLEEAFFRRNYKDTSSVLYGKDYAKTFKEYYYGRKDPYGFEGKRKNTIIRDFDFDGDLDVLFTGHQIPGAENTNIILFFNTGKSYTVHHMGIWLDTMFSDSSRYYFRTSNFWPSEIQTCSMEFEVVMSEPHRIRLLSNEIFSYYSPQDSLIKKMDITIRFTEKKEFYFQANPDLTYIRKHNSYNDQIIGTIPENYDLHAYDYAVVDGKIWYYIVLPADDNVDVNKYYRENSYGKVQFLRGWVCGE